MTRANILEQYTIKNGIIANPGRFEAQALYVPYFWDAYLNGFADSDDGEVLTFNVNDDERNIFPELKGRNVVRLTQSEQGFVSEV